MLICTVSTANNLHRAKVMANSVKLHQPEATVVLCLVEEQVHPALEFASFDEVILAKQLEVPRFYELMYKYFVAEAAIAMKAPLLSYVWKQYPDEHLFVYLDTDLKLYYPLVSLVETMREHPVLITPHRTEQSLDPLGYLHHGVYNTGFIALTRSMEAYRFLRWWEDRLHSHCYYDAPFFVDQKWMDLAPAFFDVHISKHPGYNMAAWNLHEQNRQIVWEEHGRYWFADGDPLCCFHFSGLHGMLQYCLAHFVPADNVIHELLPAYEEELRQAGQEELQAVGWSYDQHSDGAPVTAEMRWTYRRLLEKRDQSAAESNPFEGGVRL